MAHELEVLEKLVSSDPLVIEAKQGRLENMKGIEWIKSKRIFYWSDLDAHGMQMLSQLRSYFPQTQSIFMDLETLNRFKGYWVKGTVTKVTRLPT